MKMKYVVDTKIMDNHRIVLETYQEFEEHQVITLTNKIIDLEDQSIREALIKLGWTPPKKNERKNKQMQTYDEYRQQKLSEMIRETEAKLADLKKQFKEINGKDYTESDHKNIIDETLDRR